MTRALTPSRAVNRANLLDGLRVQISGAVPEEQYWPQPNLNEKILAFVARLAELVLLYGGRIVHGNHPGFTPAIIGRAQAVLDASSRRAAVAATGTAPVTLVASELWPLSWEFPLRQEVVHVIRTPRIGAGDAHDPDTRNRSLTALRLTMVQQVDVVVTVGGKLHRDTGYNPGVLEELTVARWHKIPCFIVASYGGFTGEFDAEMLRQFSAGNALAADAVAGRPASQALQHLATTNPDVESLAGGLVAHLVEHRGYLRAASHSRADWPAIPIRTSARGDSLISAAEVSMSLIEQSAERLRDVQEALITANAHRLRELLGALTHGRRAEVDSFDPP